MSRAGQGGADDPGLARARTRLAWTRTALSFAAIGALILKRDLAGGLVVLLRRRPGGGNPPGR